MWYRPNQKILKDVFNMLTYQGTANPNHSKISSSTCQNDSDEKHKWQQASSSCLMPEIYLFSSYTK